MATTWRELIADEAVRRGDKFEDLTTTLTTEQLDSHPDRWEDETAFTAWSDKYVYFPVHDPRGSDCASVPRHPVNREVTESIGNYD